MDLVTMHDFHTCVARYRGHRKVKSFSCWDQYLCMVFAQLTYRESLRDIEACLRAVSSKLYHAGFRGKVSRNTLANANAKRDWRIYRDFAHLLIAEARKLYAGESLSADLVNTVYALDSTTIDLCLSLCPWARYRKQDAGIKVHTMLDLRGNIPTLRIITGAQIHDVTILDRLFFEPGAFYVVDRGYLDYARLYRIHQEKAWFVVRAKKNLVYRRQHSQQVEKESGVMSDQIILLTNRSTCRRYPEKLRRIRCYDVEKDSRITLLTNDMILPSGTIADLYRARWQIEIFFRWIKQNLRIKRFYGTSKNAVKTQIWIALSVYVTVAILKKRSDLEPSLSSLLQVPSLTLFEKEPIKQLLTIDEYRTEQTHDRNQLVLFN